MKNHKIVVHDFACLFFAPHTPMLRHVCFHPEEKAALADVMSWGFVDVFRKHEPGEKQFSFFDYRMPKAVERNLGWRLDHILATEPMVKRSGRAWIDKAPRMLPRPSDHTPVIVEF